jgi:hypothetical protein
VSRGSISEIEKNSMKWSLLNGTPNNTSLRLLQCKIFIIGIIFMVDTKVVLVLLVLYYEFGVKMQYIRIIKEFYEHGAS